MQFRLWRDDPKRLFKRLAWEILWLVMVPVFILGLVITQPGCARNRPSSATVDPQRLRAHVVKLCEELFPLSYDETQNLARASEFIASEFARAGGKVTNQYYTAGGTEYRNVVACFGPSTGALVVVGAHYDTCQGTPGADDNASGVAGLIELAYLLGRTNNAVRVECVAYCTEEPPFFAGDGMGSIHHARWLRERGDNVTAALVLEMIGTFSDAPGSQDYPVRVLHLMYPSRGNYIGIVGNTQQRALVRRTKALMNGATDLPVRSISAPEAVPGVTLSDHRNYWTAGLPAVMITDTAFLRNHNYHTAGDTADRLDYARMAKVVIGVYEAVQGLGRTSVP